MYQSEEQLKQQKLSNLNNLMLALGHLAMELNKNHGPRVLGALDMSRAWGAVTTDEPLILRDICITLHMLTPKYFAHLVDLMLELQPDYVPKITSRVFAPRSEYPHDRLLQELKDFSLRVKDGLFSPVSLAISGHDRMYLEVWALGNIASVEIRALNSEVFGPNNADACIEGSKMRNFMLAGGFDLLMEAVTLGIISRQAFTVSMNYVLTDNLHSVVDQRSTLYSMVEGWPVHLHDANLLTNTPAVQRLPMVRYLLCQHFGELFYQENAKSLHEMVTDAILSYSGRAYFGPAEMAVCPEEMEDAALALGVELGHIHKDNFGHRTFGWGYDRLFMQMRAQPGLIERMKEQHKTGWFATEVFMLLTVEEIIHDMIKDRLPLGVSDMPVVTAHQCGLDK